MAGAVAAEKKEKHPALSPAEALTRFQIEPGLRIELVAAEPLVINPVAFAFDPRGRLYVVEGRGYPDPVQGGGKTTEGRIAVLEDVDGDGRYERRTEFATGLGYVNGILPWRGGVLVTAAPDILYLKDTDGDGVADERRVVLTGFDATKTAQLRVSHPTLGFDGKVYVTSGINGGKVVSPAHPERAPVVFNSRDGRFDPDTLEFENTGGRAQFGLTFDAFGRRFICSNRHPVLQVMLEPWQLQRNPHLAFTDTTQEVSRVEAEAKVWPISRATISADFVPALMAAPHTGTFTSASGVLVWGGTGLAAEHAGNVFICESAQNLVQRQVLRAEGASMRAEPATKGKEFLSSTDVWFRPVFLGHGPDGALYVADMYRREIDHPRYVPEESRGLLDFEGGKDRGRIYRIVKDGPRAGRAMGMSERATQPAMAGLVAELDSAEEWRRATAQRLLLEGAAQVERETMGQIEKIATASARPEARTRALWTLRGVRGLTAAAVLAALRDAHAGVREQGVQLAGEMMARGAEPELLAAVVALARDSEARVRFCAALALGSVADAAAVPALARIAVRDGEDRWTRAAVLSGVGGRMSEFLAALQGVGAENPRALALVMEDLGRVLGAGATPEACRQFLAPLLTSDGPLAARISATLGLAEGWRTRAEAKDGTKVRSLAGLLGDGAGAWRTFLEAAAAQANDGRVPAAERARAVALLGQADFEFAGARLGQLLDAREPPDVQLQAVRALERLDDARAGGLLIAKENWSRYTPQIREAVFAALTAKPALIGVLLGAVERGEIAPTEISSVRRTQLVQHRDPAVKARAEAVLKNLEGSDRMQVYRNYRAVLKPDADVARGREAFLRVCSACHTHNGTGGKVGPDLTGIRNQPADAILLHLIVPNYEVASNYRTVSVVTNDGRSFAGWLAAETEHSLTLRTAAGTEEAVLRRNIASVAASGVSLMPDGLEQAMTKDEVAGLVAFLKSGN